MPAPLSRESNRPQTNSPQESDKSTHETFVLQSDSTQHMEELIEQFEDAWQGGLRPDIEEFLPDESESRPEFRSKVLGELVRIDWEFRLKGGEVPTEADYCPRFPELAANVPLWQELRGVREKLQKRQGDSGSSTSVTEFGPGAVVGDYELIEEIARGGMGVVFKARHAKLKRTVALKMILRGELATTELVERFLAEARSAAKLEHSGIVPVYEIGQHGSRHFFAMQFVEGMTLAQRLQRGPLKTRVAAKLVRQIA
jgi:serine/threonine-protein kinase